MRSETGRPPARRANAVGGWRPLGIEPIRFGIEFVGDIAKLAAGDVVSRTLRKLPAVSGATAEMGRFVTHRSLPNINQEGPSGLFLRRNWPSRGLMT